MTRWQKDYLDVPADDYLSSQTWLTKMGQPMSYVPPTYDLIGPHENRYLNLMRMGLKPVTLLDVYHISYWSDDIDRRGWTLDTLKWKPVWSSVPYMEYIVALPGQEWRIAKIKSIHDRITRYGLSEVDEVRLGFLLGYTKRCIAAYIERKRYIDRKDWLSANQRHLNFID